MSTLPHPLHSYKAFVLSKEAPAPEFSVFDIRLTHATLGLSTELLELDQSTSRTNTIEELEDLLWYLTLNADVLSFPIGSLAVEFAYNHKQNALSFDELKASAERYLSLCKKLLIYRSEVRPQVVVAFGELWLYFLKHASACNTNLLHLIDGNRKKLDTRYTSSFSQKESEVRRDKQDEEDL